MSDKKQKKITSKYTWITATMGFSSVVANNFLLKKFWYQAFHRHIIGTIIGAGIGTWIGQYANKKYARRDYIINDYKAKHPDYFKTERTPLVGERFDRWTPIR